MDGMRGRTPKPAAQRKATSKRSNQENERRINAEPKYLKQEFTPPTDLDEVALKHWGELTAIFKEMKNCPICDADRHIIAIACKAFSNMTMCEVELRKKPDPIVIVPNGNKDKDGNTKYTTAKNPYWQMLKAARDTYIKCCSQLCLDVVSRAKVGTAKVEGEKDKDILDILESWNE